MRKNAHAKDKITIIFGRDGYYKVVVFSLSSLQKKPFKKVKIASVSRSTSFALDINLNLFEPAKFKLHGFDLPLQQTKPRKSHHCADEYSHKARKKCVDGILSHCFVSENEAQSFFL